MLMKQQSTLIVLFAALLGGGLLSVFFGKDLSWDLANYHYYNPYAYIHHRAGLDYWPTSFIQQYLNPAMDFGSYFLITYTNVYMAEFILGAIQGLNGWLLFLITRWFIPEENNLFLAIFITLAGMCGPLFLPSLGSMQNDNIISILIFLFIFLQLQSLPLLTRHTINTKLFFISGLILGAAVGLKLTAGIYGVGALFAILFLDVSLPERFRFCLILTFSILAGLSLTGGYWMMKMWHQHHNPVFPFLNQLFRSPDFMNNNWQDIRFMPHGKLQTIFFPFYFSWDGRTSDLPFRDFRFVIVYLLFFLQFIKTVFIRSKHPIGRKKSWLFCFFIFSYIVWQYYFSIARYLLPLEMLSPLIIYLLLDDFIKNNYFVHLVVIIVLSFLITIMKPISPTRAFLSTRSYLHVQIPQNLQYIPAATVLIAYPAYVLNFNPRPQAYLIPFFPHDWHFVGIPFIHHRFYADKQTLAQLKSIIHRSSEKMYLLAASDMMPELYRTAGYFHLLPDGHCVEIKSDRQMITQQIVLLCPVKEELK